MVQPINVAEVPHATPIALLRQRQLLSCPYRTVEARHPIDVTEVPHATPLAMLR